MIRTAQHRVERILNDDNENVSRQMDFIFGHWNGMAWHNKSDGVPFFDFELKEQKKSEIQQSERSDQG